MPLMIKSLIAEQHDQSVFLNANVETAKRAAAALDMFNVEGTVQHEPVEMVNSNG